MSTVAPTHVVWDSGQGGISLRSLDDETLRVLFRIEHGVGTYQDLSIAEARSLGQTLLRAADVLEEAGR